MDSTMSCPHDPAREPHEIFDIYPCPVCGCLVFTGQEHMPCVDPHCHFYVGKNQHSLAQSKMLHPSHMRTRMFSRN